MNSLLKQKRGWIKIVEAFIAVLLITGALLIVVQKGYIGGRDISEKVYEAQKAILREVELDDELREAVLSSKGSSIPLSISNLIEERKPDYLECEAVICDLDVICVLDNNLVDKDIYAQSVAIAMTLKSEKLRQLKLFCWKE